jgi:hypothetical protein
MNDDDLKAVLFAFFAGILTGVFMACVVVAK